MKDLISKLNPKSGDFIVYYGKVYEFYDIIADNGITFYRSIDYSNGEFYYFCKDEVVEISGNKNDLHECLRFYDLKKTNTERCEKHFHAINDWSLTDWACAVAGEVGEMCNMIKKLKRGENIDINEIGKEIADVVIYSDLLATRLGLSLSKLVTDKFNEVSDRVNCNIKL